MSDPHVTYSVTDLLCIPVILTQTGSVTQGKLYSTCQIAMYTVTDPLCIPVILTQTDSVTQGKLYSACQILMKPTQ